MPPPRWLALRRRPQPEATRTVEPDSRTPPGPQGPWLTAPDFSARLRSATLTLLDLVEDVMHDDFTLTEAIDGFRYHAADLLNIPDQYGILVEACAPLCPIAPGTRAGATTCCVWRTSATRSARLPGPPHSNGSATRTARSSASC